MRKAIRDFFVWALCVTLAVVALVKCQGNIDLTDNGSGRAAYTAPTPTPLPTVQAPSVTDFLKGLLK